MKNYETSLYEILDPLSVKSISEFVDIAKRNRLANNISEDKFQAVIEVADKIINNRCGIIIENGNIFIKNIQPLLEIPVYSGKINNHNYMIGCYDDENRNFSKFTAYFKFLNSDSFKQASKMARITILDPTYINHENMQGKEKWILSSAERSILNTIMHINLRGETVWYWTCYEFCRKIQKEIDFGIEIPDFNVIKSAK